MVEVRGANRYVLPGLLDIHTHVAYGATTPGVGMACVHPDTAGVQAGATLVLDAGSVGIANVGVFSAHLVKQSKTRVITFVNMGTFAHTTPSMADVSRIEEIDRAAIASCVNANPDLIGGFKVRLVGPIMQERGPEIVKLCKEIASEHQRPLMVHVGDGRAADPAKANELTRLLLRTLTKGDILTHLCTPHPGGVMADGQVVPEVEEARSRGVTMDSALGRGNFSFEIARKQRDLGVAPDTTSSDITGGGRTRGVGVLDSMSKFLAVGYSLSEVVRMVTSNAARALGLENELGTLAVGRTADISIVDSKEGNWKFDDTVQFVFTGKQVLVPVQTIRAGELCSPDWGPYPWGWLPPEA